MAHYSQQYRSRAAIATAEQTQALRLTSFPFLALFLVLFVLFAVERVSPEILKLLPELSNYSSSGELSLIDRE